MDRRKIMKNFRIWFLNESTVVQLLKRLKNPYVDQLTQEFLKIVKTNQWANQIPDNKLMLFVKWVLFPLFSKQDQEYSQELKNMQSNEKYSRLQYLAKRSMGT